MTRKKKSTSEKRAARRDMADISEQLAAVQSMTVSELHDKYRELYGEPSRSRNKQHLQRKIAWRIQELAEGGLSENARVRMVELTVGLPHGWLQRLQNPRQARESAKAEPAKPERIARKRDSRLPTTGSTLTRIYKGKEHTVTVLESGFEHDGQIYTSLSKVAHAITGTPWNGFTFFGLKKNKSAKTTEQVQIP